MSPSSWRLSGTRWAWSCVATDAPASCWRVRNSRTARCGWTTESYLPVKLVNSVPNLPEPVEALIDWNVPVDITPPDDAREVTTDEFSFAFFALFLSMAFTEGGVTTPTAAATPSSSGP